MLGGYMGKMLFVNLSTGELKIEEPEESLYRDYMGGYGIGARLLYSRMQPGADPLGPDNILGFGTGPLTGTPALFGNRYTVFAKSPLTGGWGDANSGGDFGPALKFAGFDAVLISGVSPKPVYLLLDAGKPSIKDASHLWGKDSNETEDILREENGKKVQVACIGPSGEKLSYISCVINNKGRAAGRSGLGAVMGAKRLKAVVAKGNLAVPVDDAAGFAALRKEALKALGGPTADRFKKFGTCAGTGDNTRSGDAPVKNWGGVGVVDIPSAIEILNGENVVAHEAKKYGCWRCPVACGGVMAALNKDYQLEAGAHKPEYETMAAFGPMCLNDNVESLIVANDICNRAGLDTISAGATIAFAMECYENGLINKQDTGGIELTWGNHRAMNAMLEKLAKREGFGDILADGVKIAAAKIGKNAADFAIHIDGQELPMHDAKLGAHFYPVYHYDATPARHTQAFGEMHVLNSSGVCMFGNFVGNAAFMSRYLSLATGREYSPEDLKRLNGRIHNLRHAFNLREGINPKDRTFPDRGLGRPPQEAGPLAGKTVDVEGRTAKYLAANGWDPATFKPLKQTLLDQGLDDVAEDLWD
ncbi:MAG: aldehyde ferredoxin oxidoreductase family protein [Dehalococcoidia bacterium]|nr:aldehyde ferredoxin oxidoreductase family protein [Dehalococcoidia bacterium]